MSPQAPLTPATTVGAPSQTGSCHGLAEHWHGALAQQLQPGEAALAAFSLDLDERLQFGDGVVVLTEHRWLAHLPQANSWQVWPLTPGLQLRHGDHAGVGMIELLSANARLLHCRFTLNQNLAALRLLSAFERQVERLQNDRPAADNNADEDDALCPICKAPLPADEDECPTCVRELHTPPSTWTLLRLWRFARPYKWPLLAGFLLTLASTGATLVPPYLTMPLMDKVLIPFQNGGPIDRHLVLLLLAGILGSALLAWVLGWART